MGYEKILKKLQSKITRLEKEKNRLHRQLKREESRDGEGKNNIPVVFFAKALDIGQYNRLFGAHLEKVGNLTFEFQDPPQLATVQFEKKYEDDFKEKNFFMKRKFSSLSAVEFIFCKYNPTVSNYRVSGVSRKTILYPIVSRKLKMLSDLKGLIPEQGIAQETILTKFFQKAHDDFSVNCHRRRGPHIGQSETAQLIERAQHLYSPALELKW